MKIDPERMMFVKFTGQYGPIYINIDELVGIMPGKYGGTVGSGSELYVRTHTFPFSIQESPEIAMNMIWDEIADG